MVLYRNFRLLLSCSNRFSCSPNIKIIKGIQHFQENLLTSALRGNSFCTSTAPNNIVVENTLKEKIERIIQIVDSDLHPKDLESTVIAAPELLNFAPFRWKETFSAFTAEGFSVVDCLDMIVLKPDLLKCSSDQLSDAIFNWRECQLGEKNILSFLVLHPDLIFVDRDILKYTVSVLLTLCKEYKVIKVFQSCPNILTEPQGCLQDKIDYVINKFKAKRNQIPNSGVLRFSVEEIKTRHVFLERTGAYKTPREEPERDDISNNPILHDIFSSSDFDFATKIAKVTLEEFEIFQELFAEEMMLESEEEYFYSDDEKGGFKKEIIQREKRKKNRR